jgi:hypothetical protein
MLATSIPGIGECMMKMHCSVGLDVVSVQECITKS